MRLTPPTHVTMQVSMACSIAAALSLIFGQFLAAAVLGTASAINLLAAAILKKY
jgi:hypothetical protein